MPKDKPKTPLTEAEKKRRAEAERVIREATSRLRFKTTIDFVRDVRGR